jgi:hypothetical protein
MGLKSQLLPDNILRRMSKPDRSPLGKAGVTSAEAMAQADRRAEKELQADMENMLRVRDIFFVRARMDKKHTLPKGTPDFLIFLRGGRALAVEVKVHGGMVSEDQARVFDEFYFKTGEPVRIVANIEMFKNLLNEHCK